jgi:putative ABC transport system permease protein
VASSSGSLAGLGATLAFTATVALSPVVVPAAMAVAGAVLGRLGVAGRLAVANAARNPRRSAATASALTIGVMLVVGASMFAATAKETVQGDVATVIDADRVVRAAGSSAGVPATLADELTEVPDLAAVPIRETYVSVEGDVRTALGADLGAADDLLAPIWAAGRPGAGISLSSDVAEASGASVGDVVAVTFASGDTEQLPVTGIFEPSTALADVVVPYGSVARNASESLDARILLSGPPEALEQAAAAVASVPTAIVETPEAFAAHRAGTLDTVLGIVVGFLGFAVVIAVLGIGTTIALSVRERTRELGVLRSIGMSRRHLRRTIRLEAISIAGLGAVLGASVGLLSTWALLRTLSDQGFADPVVPGGALVAVAVGALAAGVISSANPARRAARMPVLEAVRTD